VIAGDGGHDACTVELRRLAPEDWPRVREIYREGIESGDATFERSVPGWAEWDAGRRPEPRIVAVRDDTVVGFAVLSPVSRRPVYGGVCEVMIYVADGARGQGIGSVLMTELVRASEAAGVWTLQASIFPENVASARIHERAGFREVGRRERIGRFHDGRWRDTVLLERRSPVVGVEDA
jgi:L-amino acid N-acyltransferase YncA